MSTILIGVDASPRSESAVAFARQLARASSASVVLACAYPYNDGAFVAVNTEIRTRLKAGAEETLRRTAGLLAGIPQDRVRTVSVADVSPARALSMLAETEKVDLIVLGSTHTGHLGRVMPGSTAERVLHGAPCPVAIVPAGYRGRSERGIRRIGAAVDGSPEGAAALRTAAEVARATGAVLRAVKVLDATMYATPALMGGPSQVRVRDDLLRAARWGLEEAIGCLADDVPVEPVLCEGDPVHELAAQSRELDLLVAGSRGYGPLRAVLLGGVTGRLIREAACPLIVLPRGIASPLAELFARGTTAVS